MSEQATGDHRSIAQIGRMVRSIVEVETLDKCYWVGGKVNRYHKSDRGHIYFELVDGYNNLHYMLPERQSNYVDFDIKNDMEIEVYGDIQVYENNVQVQLIVQKAKLIDAQGQSVISAINQLTQEGLYPTTPKQPPEQPNQIGIITSRSSRAIGDFENTYQLMGQKVVLPPVIWEYVKLEGEEAVESIIEGIDKLQRNTDIDIIAIIRGGGRYENLVVFDDIDIARKIATSPKYIITGIGHYKDATLADEVADYVASTPTAVAHYLANLVITSTSGMTESNLPNRTNQITNLLIVIIGILFITVVVLLILNFT